jgi:hypothetical protein
MPAAFSTRRAVLALAGAALAAPRVAEAAGDPLAGKVVVNAATSTPS